MNIPNYEMREIDGSFVKTNAKKIQGNILSYSVEFGTTGFSHGDDSNDSRTFLRITISGKNKPCIIPNVKHVSSSDQISFNCTAEGDQEYLTIFNIAKDIFSMMQEQLGEPVFDYYHFSDDFNIRHKPIKFLKLETCPICGRNLRASVGGRTNSAFASCLGFINSNGINTCDFSKDISDSTPIIEGIPAVFADRVSKTAINAVNVPCVSRAHSVKKLITHVEVGSTGVMRGTVNRGAKTSIFFNIKGNPNISISKRVIEKTGAVEIIVKASGSWEFKTLYLILMDILYSLDSRTIAMLKNQANNTDTIKNPKAITRDDKPAYVRNMPCPKCLGVLRLYFARSNGHRFIGCTNCNYTGDPDFENMVFTHKKPSSDE